MRIRRLSELDCTKLLARNHFGHLGCAKDGKPYIVPIYFAYHDNHIYAFSMPGRKIDFMRANASACFQVDERGRGREWRSVLIEGRYEELTDQPGYKVIQERAWSLLSQHINWWEPGGLKPDERPIVHHSTHLFWRISVDQVSGREATEDDAS